MIKKNLQYYRFSAYGFLKNLRFFEPFIILIFRDNGLTFLQIGLLYSIRDITNYLTEIPTGFIADAFGRRRSMVFAFIAYIVSFVIFFSFSDFYLSAFAMVLFGLGYSRIRYSVASFSPISGSSLWFGFCVVRYAQPTIRSISSLLRVTKRKTGPGPVSSFLLSGITPSSPEPPS